MLDFHLHKARCLAVFMALFLFLPCMGAFAAYTGADFTFSVRDSSQSPVAGAMVYVWDKSNSQYNYNSGSTDTSGMVTVGLPAITTSPNSTSNPSPNIGYFVVPKAAAGSQLTWKVGQTLFYNLFNIAGAAPSETIPVVLANGVKVTINPITDEVAGLKHGLRISVPLVPSNFKTIFNVYNSDLDATSKSYDVYWPQNESIYATIDGDSNQNTYTSEFFYSSVGSSFPVAEEDASFEIKQNRNTKVLFTLKVLDTDNNIDANATSTLYWKNAYWDTSWQNVGTNNGSCSIYLSKGSYDFKAQPQGTDATTGKYFAQYLFPNVDVSTDTVKTFVPANGVVVEGSIALGDASIGDKMGNISDVQTIKAEAYQKFETSGYAQWEKVQTATIQDDGSYRFFSLFREDSTYKIVLVPASYYYQYSSMGVIDRSDSSEYKCYTYAQPKEFDTVRSKVTLDAMVCPQAPLFQTKILLASGAQYNRGTVAMGYMPEENMGGYSVYDYDDGDTFYVPFAQGGRKMVVRADFTQTDENSVIPTVKIFDPVMLSSTGTTVAPDMVFDPAAFVTVNGNAILNGEIFDGNGKVQVYPVASGTNVSLQTIFSSPVYNKEFKDDAGFSFQVEKGQAYVLSALPSERPGIGGYDLNTFAPYKDIYPVPADAAATVEHDIVLPSGAVLDCRVLHNGKVLGSSDAVFVTVTGEGRDQWGNFSKFTKTGIASEGLFLVSGLTTGDYSFVFNIDGVNLGTTTMNYTSQIIPWIHRDIYVDEEQDPASMSFNFADASIGVLVATITNDLGLPMEGLFVQITKQGEQITDSWGYTYIEKGPIVFYCHTNADGQIVDGTGGPIPLENGDYDMYIVGQTNPVDGITYSDFSQGDKFASFHINSGYPTLMAKSLTRSFTIEYELIKAETTTASETAFLGLSGHVLDDSGLNVGYIYANAGLPNVKLKLGLHHFLLSNFSYDTPDGWAIFFHETYNVTGTATHKFVLNIDDLNTYNIDTVDSNGEILANAGMNVVLLSDKTQGLNAPYSILHQHYYAATSDEFGKLILQLPELPDVYKDSGAYAIVPLEYTIPDVNGDDLAMRCSPATQTTILPSVPSDMTIVWNRLSEIRVSISDANFDETSGERLIGMLVKKEVFANGWESWNNDSYMHETEMGHDMEMFVPEESLLPQVTTFKDGKFRFVNTYPGSEYVLLIYKSPTPLVSTYNPSQGLSEYQLRDYFKAVLRHISVPIIVDKSLVEVDIAQLTPLAPLNVMTAPENFIQKADDARLTLQFAADAEDTVDNVGFPIVLNHDVSWAYNKDAEIPFPLMVPANRALKIGFSPVAAVATTTGEVDVSGQYLPKIVDNVMVPSVGLDFVLNLGKLQKLSGTFTNDGYPETGFLMLFPEGADLTSDDALSKVTVQNGLYKTFLPAGVYNGYAVPSVGAPSFMSLTVGATSDTQFDIQTIDGVFVTGSIIDADGAGVPNVKVNVMRKLSPISELLDGTPFYPYPALMGENIVPCDAEGNFGFAVEPNVDYYLQVIVPAGYRPGSPVKVSVGTGDEDVDAITIFNGAVLKGTVKNAAGNAVMAFIEAKPSTTNSLVGEFGELSLLSADSDAEGNFMLFGADPTIPYDIYVHPDPISGLAEKVITNVLSDDAAKLAITLVKGHTIAGQLLDVTGQPLAAAGVKVNLAMNLMAEPVGNPSLRSSLRVMQSIRADVTSPTSFKDTIEFGLWTETDASGRFTFRGVPDFLFAFVKTDNGFVLGDIDYGRGRTDTFSSESSTEEMMQVDIEIPRGGKIIGKLIDITGLPIANATVEASFGDMWAETQSDTKGDFVISGVTPKSSYLVNVTSPSYVEVYKPSILVQPEQTTDLGTTVMYRSVAVNGKTTGVDKIIEREFPYGVTEDHALIAIAIDGTRASTEEELLSGDFMKRVTGSKDLIWDSASAPINLDFSIPVKSGLTDLGLLMFTDSELNGTTFVSWGWKSGLSVPTFEQLGSGSFTLPTGNEIVSPMKFGVIEGSLAHAVDASATFNMEDAVIVFYPVSGDDNTLDKVPFPTALTRPVDGMWFVDGIPQGKYRIKVITSRFGSQFFKDIVEIGETIVNKPLVIGNSVKKIYGRVVATGTKNVISSARVSLIAEGISTSTDADGIFSFYMPAGAHVLPQIEVKKTGYEAMRQFSFGANIATDGIILKENVNLGDVELVKAPGLFTITVIASETSAPIIGAEVAMVSKNTVDKMDVWTVGQKLITDAGGQVTFTGVPANKQLIFRATTHYYDVGSYTYTIANNVGGVGSASVSLAKAKPLVFYTGRVTAVDADKIQLDARFDFNQVVEQNKVHLEIGQETGVGKGSEIISDSRLSYPDSIGLRITNMIFNGHIASQSRIVASVTYDVSSILTSPIGVFDVLGGGVFRKEFPVDPTSEDGFVGRKTDEQGNMLPTGLAVPAGYLDPSIGSFELNEELASGTPDGIDGGEFASPIFEFTFNHGSNFGGATEQHQGLFEVTIPYTKGTKLEPMWQNPANGQWSKVGIIEGSTKWDSPSDGYVTFKVSHLTKFAVLANVASSSSGVRGDFDGDSVVDIKDVVYELAWIQSGKTTDKALVAKRAAEIYAAANGTVVNLPVSGDDVNGDALLDISDVVLTLSWIQSGKSNDASLIKKRAAEIYTATSGTVSNFPAETINR